MVKEYKVLHLFCGIGGGALGFQRARARCTTSGDVDWRART